MAARGSPLAGYEEQELRTPTPSKLGRGGGGQRRFGAGGGRLPGLGWCRARVRTERAAATRGWSRSEVTGGAGAGARAGNTEGRAGAAGASSAASRSRAALRAVGCGDWRRRRPSPWARLRRRRPLLAAALCAPAAAGLRAEPECPSRGGGQPGPGGVVTVLGTSYSCLIVSISVCGCFFFFLPGHFQFRK